MPDWLCCPALCLMKARLEIGKPWDNQILRNIEDINANKEVLQFLKFLDSHGLS